MKSKEIRKGNNFTLNAKRIENALHLLLQHYLEDETLVFQRSYTFPEFPEEVRSHYNTIEDIVLALKNENGTAIQFSEGAWVINFVHESQTIGRIQLQQFEDYQSDKGEACQNKNKDKNNENSTLQKMQKMKEMKEMNEKLSQCTSQIFHLKNKNDEMMKLIIESLEAKSKSDEINEMRLRIESLESNALLMMQKLQFCNSDKNVNKQVLVEENKEIKSKLSQIENRLQEIECDKKKPQNVPAIGGLLQKSEGHLQQNGIKIQEIASKEYDELRPTLLWMQLTEYIRQFSVEKAKFIIEPGFAKIRYFNFDDINLGVFGARLLSGVSCFEIRTAEFSNCSFGDEGIFHIAQAKWPKIQSLNLGSNNIGKRGAKYLSVARWPQLQKLYLNNNRIGNGGVKHLTKANWPELTQLFLDNNNLGIRGMKYLSFSHWPQFKQIHLQKNRITKLGVKHLSMTNWPQARWVRLSMDRMGESGAAEILTENWPKIQTLLFLQ